jgi:peroxiredoxin
MCREAAPHLVRMHEKFKNQGVVFLGFTTHRVKRAEEFLRRCGISWPNAYGIRSLSTIAPAIYVIGTDGRIIWSDGQARYHHAILGLAQGLDAALKREVRRHATN